MRVEIPVTAYVPPEYIAYEATKIDAHRRIARARDLRELEGVRAELTDRFGPPPEPVEALLRLQGVRIRAAEAEAAAVAYRAGRLSLDGLELDDAWAARLRAAEPRVAYFKARRLLVAHAPAEVTAAAAPSGGRPDGVNVLLGWVSATLDAILRTRSAVPATP